MAVQEFTTQELTNEIWKPVVGFEGFYSVSSLGRIKRIRASKATQVGKVLKPLPNQKGYHRVNLFDRPRHKTTCYVHILVAAAFIGPRPAGYEVNHMDTAKANNRLANLEYRTHAGNMQHALENDRFPTGDAHYSRREPERMGRGENHGTKTHPESVRKGERHHRAKLTNADILIIRSMLADHVSHASIAQQFGVARPTITYIAMGKTWAGVQ